MTTRNLLLIVSLALVFTAFSWGSGQAWAQSQTPMERKSTPESTITDAAGRVHNVMPMRKTTQAQRKEASARLKATLDAKAARDNQTAVSPQGEVAK
jgi:hypothetical protein